MILNKQKIEAAFDQGMSNYDWAAVVQKEVGENLMAFTPDAAPQNILEIGCGTGFLTNNLIRKYPNSTIIAIDISEKMIEKCQSKLPFTTFEKADAEIYQPSMQYDLIISNMTFQWFENPVHTINRYKKFLKPKGKILFSTLGKNNFWQWQAALDDLNLSSRMLSASQYEHIIQEEEIKTMYQNPFDFAKSLKDMGASSSNQKPLSISQFKQACEIFKSKYCCSMTWHILYGEFTKS